MRVIEYTLTSGLFFRLLSHSLGLGLSERAKPDSEFAVDHLRSETGMTESEGEERRGRKRRRKETAVPVKLIFLSKTLLQTLYHFIQHQLRQTRTLAAT